MTTKTMATFFRCFRLKAVMMQCCILSFLCQGLWSFSDGFHRARPSFVNHRRADLNMPRLIGKNARFRRSSSNKQHQLLARGRSKLWLSKDDLVYGSNKNSTASLAAASQKNSDNNRSGQNAKSSDNTSSSLNETNTSTSTIDDNNKNENPDPEKVLSEVAELRARAKRLRAEAQAEEQALLESRSSQRSQRIQESDEMVDQLFHGTGIVAANSTRSRALEKKIADQFRNERWSPDQAIMVLERLQERQIRVQDRPTIMTPSQAAVSRPSVNTSTTTVTSMNPNFQIGDTRNALVVANDTEWLMIDGWISMLINAASLLDEEYNDKMTSSKAKTTEATIATTEEPESSTAQEEEQNSNKEASLPSSNNINTRWTGRVGPALKSRRKELIRADEEELKRIIATNVNAVVNAAKMLPSNSNSTAKLRATTTPGMLADDIQEYARQTLGISSSKQDQDDLSSSSPPDPTSLEVNISRVVERIASVPLWVPSALLPLLASSRATLRKEDVTEIKDTILMGTRFFCTSSDAIPSAAIFRGNIRSPAGLADGSRGAATGRAGKSGNGQYNHTAVVFEEIQRKLQTKEGLADRIQLFMMEDPEWSAGRDNRTPQPLPVILAISKKVEPTESVLEKTTVSPIAKRISSALTLVTTFSFSVSCYALNPTFFQSVVAQRDISVLLSCIPLCVGILSVQVFHEAAHFLVAKMRKIKLGRPTPIPSPQVGTFGCITPLLSFPKNRSALFDLAFSGPVAGMTISLLMISGGLYATTHATEAALSSFPVVPVGLFKCSLLTSLFVSGLAPKLMMLPLAQPIPIHPLFLSGFAGLISSALNLLPVFRLDGGRIISTLFGPRFGGISSAFTLLLMLSYSITGASGIALTWGLLVVFLQRRTEVPVRDDVTPVDDYRFGAWVGALGAALLALTPFPGAPWFL